ncbi:MAG TPA: hypothetical protein VLD16_14300 [Gaiellaceae bacterium]|nr:hypothetical protein [Gaiellaceae bacterium]
MKGIRYALRNFTARAVEEHLRSQLEDAGSDAELTPHEVELVRFATARSEQLQALAARPRG